MTPELMNDGNRLLGAKEARAYLNNMPRSTFYRNVQRGIIPRQRYLGGTPVWRLADLQGLFERLPHEPVSADARSSSR